MSNNNTVYKTIGEVSGLLDVPATILRFWEKKFPQLKPYKNNGRRYYSQHDLELITRIKQLLIEEKYSMEGAIAKIAGKKKVVASEYQEIYEAVLALKRRLMMVVDSDNSKSL